MIGRVVRGWRVSGLIQYLFGPGRQHEHTDQHVIATWDGLPGRHQPPQLGVHEFDTTALAIALTVPTLAASVPQREPDRDVTARIQGPVWHCSLRTAPGDRHLTDQEWAQVATDVLHRTGIAPAGDPGACRWVAVRHAGDHIHIAAVLVRQDTLRRINPRRDYYRVRDACLAAEQRYKLTSTTPINRTAPVSPQRAEIEKAIRAGRSEPARDRLRRVVRTAAARSASLDEFANAVNEDGLVALRWRTDAAGKVVGYAVADRRDHAHPHTGDGELVWFGGRSLAADLSLPRLLELFAETNPLPPPGERAFVERRSAWAHASDLVDQARVTAAAGAADPGLAYAAGELLLVLAHTTESSHVGGPFTTASEQFERAGRHPGRGSPSQYGHLARELRASARRMARAGLVRPDSPSMGPAVTAFVLALASLITEIGAWRAEHHQPSAARYAATTHATLTSRLTTLFTASPSTHRQQLTPPHPKSTIRRPDKPTSARRGDSVRSAVPTSPMRPTSRARRRP